MEALYKIATKNTLLMEAHARDMLNTPVDTAYGDGVYLFTPGLTVPPINISLSHPS